MQFWGRKQEGGVFLGNNKVGIARMMEAVGWGTGWGSLLEGWVTREQIYSLRSIKNTGP